MKTSTIPTLLVAGAVLCSVARVPAGVQPFVSITNCPPFGTCGYLEGRASYDPAYRVAVYIKVNDGWWNKPTFDGKLTSIAINGSWRCNVCTYPPGDRYATKICAFLVPSNSWSLVPNLDGKPLPAVLDSISLARDCCIRTPVRFSGMEWEIKATVPGGFQIDPGPSWFETNNAWLDAGKLHLKIRNETTRWTCAEVICGKEFGYGLYRFFVDTPLGAFDPSVVFSPFTYSDYPDCQHREIDIEFTTWNGTVTNGNAQYAVQQCQFPIVLERFACPSDVTQSVHSIVWSPWRIDFKSLRGHDPASTNPTDVIAMWSVTNVSRIPLAGLVRPRMALYLSNNRPPTDNREVEVIVSRFEYQPLLRFLPARLDGTGTNLVFSTQQEVAGILDLETTPSPPGNWEPLLTNGVGGPGVPMLFELPITNDQRFYRGKLRNP